MCLHLPACPPADRPDRDAARTVAFHPEQSWSLLCNGVIVFDDLGEMRKGGRGRSAWSLLGDQAQLSCPGDGLGAVGRTKLVQDMADVFLDGVDGNDKLPGDSVV
jgi:Family of unknown function (DUF5999)